MNKTFKKLPPKRQKQILNEIAEVFAEKGYYQASIPEICAQAGISTGALYKYFKNKKAIYLSVMNNAIDLLIDELFQECKAHPGPLYEALERVFGGVTKFTRRYRPYAQIWADLSSCSMNRFAKDISARMENEGKKLFRDIVQEAKERGEISKSVNTDLAVHFLDCFLTLYTYSLVSEYHRKRFDIFFGEGRKKLTQKEKIDRIIDSARSFFS